MNLLHIQAQEEEQKKYGIMRLDGEILTPAIFNDIYPWVSSLDDGQTKLVALGDSGQSVIGSEGRVISKREYDRIMTIPYLPLSEVRRDSKSGLINDEGEEVIPLIYSSFLTRYTLRNWYVMTIVEDGLKVGMIDSSNQVMIPFEYSNIKNYKNFYYDHTPSYNIALQKNKEKWALADTTGKSITPYIYDKINLFERGGACASIGDSICYFVSPTGYVVDSAYNCDDIEELDYFVTVRKENLITKNLNISLYYNNGSMIKTYEGNLLFPFSSDHLAAIKTNDDYIMIDTLGQQVSRLNVAGFFRNGLAFYNGRAVAAQYLNNDKSKNKDYRCGIIDINGNEIVPYTYYYLQLLLNNDSLNVYRAIDEEMKYHILFLKNDKATLLPQKYNYVSNISSSFDYSPGISSSLLYVENNDFKYGAISLNGEELIPTIYDGLNSYNDTLVMTEMDKKIGFYNVFTKAKIDPVFDKYKKTKAYNITIVTKDGYKGVVNTDCKLLLDCIYKDIEVSIDGAYIVATNQENQSAIFDNRGKMLRPFGKEHLQPFIKDMFIFDPTKTL